MIAVGIEGKQALWRTLTVIKEPRFARTDLKELTRRALNQHAAVEEMRLALAKRAFAPQLA